MSKLMTAAALTAPLFLSTLTSLAHAQDASYFDGWRAGVGIEDRQIKAKTGVNGLVGSVSGSRDDPAAKFSLGYDTRIGDGRFVIGGEGAAGVGDGSFTVTGANGTMHVAPRTDWQLTARAGYLFMPQTLGYVRAGYEWQDVKRTVALTGGGGGSSSSQATGGLWGLGLEQALNPRLGLRLEYDQADLSHGIRSQEIGLSGHWKF